MKAIRKVLAVAGLVALAAPAGAHTTAEVCQPARFVELSSPYIGQQRTVADEGSVTWTWRGADRHLAVDRIWSLSPADIAGDGDVRFPGVFLRTDQVEQAYGYRRPETVTRYEDTFAYAYSIFYFVEGATIDEVLHRSECRHDPAPDPAASLTADQRDRAEARRFQILRALEALDPADLM